MENFLQINEYLGNADASRNAINPERLVSYGVDFLDDKLFGVHPSELVLVGADSAVGKTEFAMNMAVQNSIIGKKVAYFKLEGDLNEFTDTQKWKIISKLYYDEKNSIDRSSGRRYHETKGNFDYIKNFSYGAYRLNAIEKTKQFERYESVATEKVKDICKNIFLYDKSERMTANNVSKMISTIYDSVDLIIIDHLHYFQMLDDVSENKQHTEIMEAVNKVVELMNVPVILVSHLRKKSNPKVIVPDMHDFMGSSNIYKIAYTCILLAPYFGMYDEENLLYPTIFRVPKSRAGVSNRVVGIKTFDGKLKRYRDGYKTGKVKQAGEIICKIDGADFQVSDFNNIL